MQALSKDTRYDKEEGMEIDKPPSEDAWEMQVEKFNLRQAILRTKLRVQNNREEPIDFVAKVILTIFGLLPLGADFKSQEYSHAYKIYSFLQVDQLENTLKEMYDYEQIKGDNSKYLSYWKAQRSLCNLAIERKKQGYQETDEKLFEVSEIEEESEAYLDCLPNKDLNSLMHELQHNLQTNHQFASDYKFWQCLLFRVKTKIAVKQINDIYSAFLASNEQRINHMLEEQL